MRNFRPTVFGFSVWLQIIFCSCVNETTLFSFLRTLMLENGSFPKIFIKKQTRQLDEKAIIELGYRKISCFVRGEPINYLPKPKACSTKSNNC